MDTRETVSDFIRKLSFSERLLAIDLTDTEIDYTAGKWSVRESRLAESENSW